MGSVTSGSAGTLKSSTIENILYEALTIGANWENDLTKNPSGERKIALSQDFAAKRINAGFTFSLTRERTATGATAFPVQSQLVDTGYKVGTGSTIISTNIYAAIVEICEELQRRDADSNKNPQNLNTVTALTYDSEALTVTGSITLVVDFSTDATGNIVSRARSYLTD